MADAAEKVKAAVRRALKRNPDMKSRDIFEQIIKTHKDVADLSVRQFHAQYVIQAKRALAPAKPAAAKAAGSKAKARKPAKRKRASTPRRKPTAGSDMADIAAAVQSRIDAARQSLTAATDGAVERASASGRIADYEKLHKALTKAAESLTKV